ncbi:hypothetical protein TVAG_026090 [Trichomonas vaginalis G3]|uniref:Uncharacterized protein n=1 Tax=Trichomonas vaginalis (strain ATCC PRA-98 / G3) TaxID=412133 RepID=A2DZ12_TRIV3|nr:protein ubiquitination [Trichomonas vaginalis G3]EAY14288.1 hypothetical protein TVAG_026090 [Trichomonas vaginalis G3]KAI5517307.1 protein ubiquitination [Trichomonas vaginalis G3]|eukprot:XP_001326511.1 hypothetical protein [Trichomonas vaginalis G3]
MLTPEADAELQKLFPDDVYRDVRLGITIQDLLEKLPTHYPADIAKVLASTSIAQSDEGILRLCCNMAEFMETYSGNNVIFAQLCDNLNKLAGPNNKLAHIKDVILKFMLDADFLSPHISARLTQAEFFAVYWKSYHISEEEIVAAMKHYHQQCPLSELPLVYFFIFFRDMIQRIDPEFYIVADEFCSKAMKTKQSFSDCFHNSVVFSYEVWQELAGAVRNNNFPDPIVITIWDDDIASFEQIASQPDFDLGQTIPNITFLPLTSTFKSATITEFAAFAGASKIFHYCLSHGADVTAPSTCLYTIPQLAAAGGNFEIIRTVSQLHLPTNGVAHTATMARRRDVFEFVQRFFPDDINHQIPRLGSVFMQCCSCGDLIGAVDLMCHGVDLNQRDNSGQIPINFAIRNGKRDITRMLLAHPKVDTSLKDLSGNSTLHYAAEYGHDDIVMEVYKRGGCNINDQNDMGFTPLMMACFRGKLRVVKKICALPELDWNVKSSWGLSALSIAVQSGYPELVNFMLEIPTVDVNTADNNGKTPLHFAAEAGFAAMVRILLSCPRVDVNLTDSEGWTPLHLAAENGFAEVVALLCEKENINPNVMDLYGMAPLHYAVRNGKVEAVQVLLSCPTTNSNIKDRRNRVPLCYTKSHPKIAELLMQHPLIEPPDEDEMGLSPVDNSPVVNFI